MKKPKFKVVAGFIEKNNKFLLVQRPFNKKNGGLWEFPGGKVEKDETLENAIKRELKEELGINVLSMESIEKIEYDYGDFFIELYLFKIKNFSGKIDLKEAVNMAWVDFDSAENLKLCPADKNLLKKLKGKINY